MSIGWLLLVFVAWCVIGAFTLLFVRMSGDQDRASRHAQKELIPFSDVTITGTGH
ncbi:MAG TPA: hypothetical protein VIK97_05985 [Casimicrobiaceae bacterium]